VRTILPHDEVNFEQIKFMHDNQPITTALQDSDMTAWAEFMDSDGHWWRCNEDGEVDPAPPSVPATVQPHPMRPAQGGSESQSTNKLARPLATKVNSGQKTDTRSPGPRSPAGRANGSGNETRRDGERRTRMYEAVTGPMP